MTATAYAFDISVSDPAIEVYPGAYYPQFSKIKAVQPTRWRLMVPYNLVCTTLAAGPYQSAGNRAVATATITGSGFVGNPHTNGSVITRVQATGAGRVGGVVPSQPGRDWHHVDNVISDIRLQVGCDITLAIGQGFPNGSNAPNGTNTDYTSFCAEVARRYGVGGPGIRTDGIYASLTGWGVSQFEIWNEQNNGIFWGFAVNAQQYTKLLQAGYAGIKSVLPSTQSVVIFGGMQHIPFEGIQFTSGYWTVDEFTFLQQCYAYGAHGYFDAMATHMYPSSDPTNPTPAQGPPNIISNQNIPAIQTSAHPAIKAFATGSGNINIVAAQDGHQLCVATATGTGVLNPYEAPGPVPSIWMDNFRQLIGIRSLMVQNGDGAKSIKITEFGYNVFSPGISPDLQQLYTQQCFDLLNLMPFIDEVHIYNTVDATNNAAPSDTSGFGFLDYFGNARPLYTWLLTLPGTSGSGTQTITATATGRGGIGGQGTRGVTATASGSGSVAKGGGVIFVTATGSGSVSPTNSGARTVTATATGVGVVGTVGSTGNFTAHGSIIGSAVAHGTGKVGVNLQKNGDLTVTALATGAGTIPHTGGVVIAATAHGSGVIINPGLEIGVVGEVTGGAPVITVIIAGVGTAALADAGMLSDTAVITGTGVVGVVGAGASPIAATASGDGLPLVIGAGAPVIAATITGVGFVAMSTDGSLAVTATATGSAGAHGDSVVTATIVGAGVVGAVTGGARGVSATAVGAGGVAGFGAGAPSIAATITGVGFVAMSTGGSLAVSATATGSEGGTAAPVITATITGAGVVGAVGGGTSSVTVTTATAGLLAVVGAGAPPITVTITGAGFVARSGGGTSTVTATGTGVGVVTDITGAVVSETAIITGAGVVGKVGGGTSTVTATAIGAGVVAVVTAPKNHMVRVLTQHRFR